MGVQCQILLQKPREGVFRPGEDVVGSFNYFIDQPTKFATIDISFIGKGRCQWSVTEANDKTVTFISEEEYVNINNNLFSLGDDKEVPVSGTFTHPFKFLLPYDIPTSINNPTCTIEYKVIATFVKDNYFKTTETFDTEVTVYGYVDPCAPEPLVFGIQKHFFSIFTTNNCIVKAEIDKTFVTPGENFTITLTADNNSDVPIVIETELIKYFTYIAKAAYGLIRKEVIETVDTTKHSSQALLSRSVTKLVAIVPTLPSLYSIQHSRILVGEFKVKVTAKVPFPYFNTSVELPVVIGERKDHLGVATQGQQEPPSYSSS